MEERLLAILRLAIKYGASDIHFKNVLNTISIDMRVNGSFYKVKVKYDDYKLIRYLQYLAKLDVGHLKEPQTGQFEMEVDGESLSLRFSVINSTNYTDGVLRILNSKIMVEPDHLSLIDSQNDYFKELLLCRQGLIIFSGPTGSGKTTTLYSLLNSIKYKKIYTIEDPIEIYNENFVQIEINEAAGTNYEEGVKQLMRHDPDVIVIGEIRDSKAAKMAVVAANTGHLVLTTIHATSSASTITRLIQLGVDEEHLYEELLCIANQRMAIGTDEKKYVVYEVMNEEEIKYYKKHKKNSSSFITMQSQINKGIKDGTFKRLVK